jgi:hypothetical protein
VPLSIVYTPNTNQTIALRNVNGQYASVIANYSWATVTQINQAFALNALATISTTGNVTVGGNLNVTGTSTSLVTKASGIVNAGVDVVLGNLKARIPTSGYRSLQVSTVSGTYSVTGSDTFSQAGTIAGSTISASSPRTINTTPAYLNPSFNFGTDGATDTWVIYDAANSIGWRITFICGPSYANNMISIERLV